MGLKKKFGYLAVLFVSMCSLACQQPVSNQADPETAAPTVEDDRAADSLTIDSAAVQDSIHYRHNHQ